MVTRQDYAKPSSAGAPVASPCRKICVVKEGMCTGCGRLLTEISRWLDTSNEDRRQIVKDAAKRLKAK